jgi:alkylated DNA repair dioxygenase AlkB
MINGLKYIPNFISVNNELDLIHKIDSQVWLTDLRRRTQHYGYKYDYTTKKIDKSLYLGPIPQWIEKYCFKLYDNKYFHKLPDQVIINEYLPGQGINKHIDCVPCFGGTVASISLNSTCAMKLENIYSHRIGAIPLAPLSLLVLSGEARYEWLHSIDAKTQDIIADQLIPRGRRISLTFRTVIL